MSLFKWSGTIYKWLRFWTEVGVLQCPCLWPRELAKPPPGNSRYASPTSTDLQQCFKNNYKIICVTYSYIYTCTRQTLDDSEHTRFQNVASHVRLQLTFDLTSNVPKITTRTRGRETNILAATKRKPRIVTRKVTWSSVLLLMFWESSNVFTTV